MSILSSFPCGLPEITFMNTLQYKLAENLCMSDQTWRGEARGQCRSL